jgi:hypothetical protein
MVFVLWSSPDHTPIKYRFHNNKSNQRAPYKLPLCQHNSPWVCTSHKLITLFSYMFSNHDDLFILNVYRYWYCIYSKQWAISINQHGGSPIAHINVHLLPTSALQITWLRIKHAKYTVQCGVGIVVACSLKLFMWLVVEHQVSYDTLATYHLVIATHSTWAEDELRGRQ